MGDTTLVCVYFHRACFSGCQRACKIASSTAIATPSLGVVARPVWVLCNHCLFVYQSMDISTGVEKLLEREQLEPCAYGLSRIAGYLLTPLDWARSTGQKHTKTDKSLCQNFS